MKKSLSGILVLILIVFIGIAAYFFTKDTTQPEVVTGQPESATSTSQTNQEKQWFKCADNTRISLLYSADKEQVELAFHDMLYNLTKDNSTSEVVYIDSVTKVTITELQGGITVKQPEGNLTIACLPTE